MVGLDSLVQPFFRPHRLCGPIFLKVLYVNSELDSRIRGNDTTEI